MPSPIHSLSNSFSIGNSKPLLRIQQFILDRKQNTFVPPSPIHSISVKHTCITHSSIHSLSETAHFYHAFTNSFSIGNSKPLSCLHQFILYRKQQTFIMLSQIHSLSETENLHHAFTNSFSIGNSTPSSRLH